MIQLQAPLRVALAVTLTAVMQVASSYADEPSPKALPVTQTKAFSQALAESLAFTHQAEIEISRLASERATSEAVRDLAEEMGRLHMDSLERITRFAPASTDIREYSSTAVPATTKVANNKPPMKIIKNPYGTDAGNVPDQQASNDPERVLIDYEDRLEAGTLRDDFGGRTGNTAQPIEGADYQELIADNRREMENKRGIGPGVSPEEYAERVAEAVDARVPALADTKARRERIDRMTEPKIDPIAEDIAEESDGVVNGSADRVAQKGSLQRASNSAAKDDRRAARMKRQASRKANKTDGFVEGMSEVWTAAAAKNLDMTRDRLGTLGGYDFDWSYLHQQHAAHTEMLATLSVMKDYGTDQFQRLVSRSIDEVNDQVKSIEDAMKILEVVASAS